MGIIIKLIKNERFTVLNGNFWYKYTKYMNLIIIMMILMKYIANILVNYEVDNIGFYLLVDSLRYIVIILNLIKFREYLMYFRIRLKHSNKILLINLSLQ